MGNQFNLIYNDEDCYGFIQDIIKSFEYSVEQEPKDEVLKEALQEAKRIYKEEDTFNVVFKCWYNAMGAYIFTRMIEVE